MEQKKWEDDLLELQRAARQAHDELSKRAECKGILFLGNWYRQSPRIFVGLNPGGGAGTGRCTGRENCTPSFCSELDDKNFWDQERTEDPIPQYWRNCKTFLKAAQGLHDWLGVATNTFCFPWATHNSGGLEALDRQTEGRLGVLAGGLFNTIVDHHRRAFPSSLVSLVLAGKISLLKVASNSFQCFDWVKHTKYSNEQNPWYQWHRVDIPEKKLRIYQVPHFSRANSQERLAECAQWLANDLQLSR